MIEQIINNLEQEAELYNKDAEFFRHCDYYESEKCNNIGFGIKIAIQIIKKMMVDKND